ncbi:MAG: hypothetical protein V4623_09555 [Pseudomonadota bacterium]
MLRIGAALLVAFMLSSCAEYFVKSNKNENFTEKLTNVYVWSGIGSIAPFTKRPPFADDTFENLFNTALTNKLTQHGVNNELHRFESVSDDNSDLLRFETKFNPDYRLLIATQGYGTMTSRGITNVNTFVLSLSIIRLADKQKIWQSEVFVDANTAPGTAWRTAGADKLADLMIKKMQQDQLF